LGIARLLLAVSLCAASVWALPGDAPGQPLFSPGQDPVAGARVFGAKGCARCHAVNGVGGKVGPDLGRIARPRSFYDVGAALWNHLPRMAERMRELGVQRPALDGQEMGDLVAFLYTLDYFDPPGNADAGRRVFADKQCILCHQVGGTGGVLGPNLDTVGASASPILLATAMWNHGPAMGAAMRQRRVERPAFKEGELADLVAFLRAAAPAGGEGLLHVLPGRADEGRRLFAAKRCVECHGLKGQGGRFAPDLGARALHRSVGQFAAAMWNKAPAMAAAMWIRGIDVPQLRVDEMADIVAYLYSVQYLEGGGDRSRGRALLASKQCLGCHSLAGSGGRAASDLARPRGLSSPAHVLAAMWNHVMDERMGRRPEPWPTLTPDEMAHLVAILESAGGRP
jgi:mono/diheme cytochrome c family protein